jgi:hypothetical protein
MDHIKPVQIRQRMHHVCRELNDTARNYLSLLALMNQLSHHVCHELNDIAECMDVAVNLNQLSMHPAQCILLRADWNES